MTARRLSLLTPALCLLVGALLPSTPVAAAPNDIDLTGLVDADGKKREGDFRLLMQEMSLVFTPLSLQPAETTGQSGFDFGIEYGFHKISNEAAYWQDSHEGRREGLDVPPGLQTLGFRGRKGFVLPVPLTSEIELGANWLIDSSLVSLGGNLRLALNEGFMWLPDIAVMAGINNVLGADELQLVTVTAGGSISKGFGIGGTMNFCPFVSYQSIFYSGQTKVIDLDPTDTGDVVNNVVFEGPAWNDFDNNRMDRVSVGARLHVAVVQITAGADFNFIPEGDERRLFFQAGARVGLLF